jgi:hypothetical protein
LAWLINSASEIIGPEDNAPDKVVRRCGVPKQVASVQQSDQV